MRFGRLVRWGAAITIALGALSCGSTDPGPAAGTSVPDTGAAPATNPVPVPATAPPAGPSSGGASTTGVPSTSSASTSPPGSPPPSAPPTSGVSSPTTQADGSCPGSGCTDYSITPVSGPAGTTIEVRAVSGACTVSEALALVPIAPPGPSIASGALTARGASQYGGAITIPPGTAPGTYLVSARAPSTSAPAGACEASFTVTG